MQESISRIMELDKRHCENWSETNSSSNFKAAKFEWLSEQATMIARGRWMMKALVKKKEVL